MTTSSDALATPGAGPSRRANDYSYLIISGGTGANSIAHAFGKSPAFVLPVSDDGGSSAEILRCFGGPSIGDIRSRLIRLIPLPKHEPRTKAEVERQAIYDLFAYRFPVDAPERVVRDIWLEIVEGRSQLWAGIGEDKKECIRAFLVHFQTLALRRAHKRFSFRNFSLGNGFLTGARDLFSSLPSAIFLFKSIAGVDPGVQVIPAINTNQTVTIAAQLQTGTQLVGQCNISHPAPETRAVVAGLSAAPTLPAPAPLPRMRSFHDRRDSKTFDTNGVTSPVERSPTLGQRDAWSRPDTVSDAVEDGNIGYRKGETEEPLEARVDRIFYINPYGQEIFPEPNPEFLDAVREREVLVYSCGSLWTSIVPCLALRGLASTIASAPALKARILLLNVKNDRETPDFKASEYVSTVAEVLRYFDRPRRMEMPVKASPIPTANLVSHIAYLQGCGIQLDLEAVQALGVQVIHVPHTMHAAGAKLGFTSEIVEWVMDQVLTPRGPR